MLTVSFFPWNETERNSGVPGNVQLCEHSFEHGCPLLSRLVLRSPGSKEEQTRTPVQAGGRAPGKQLCRKARGGFWWTPSQTWASTVPLWKRGQTASYATLGSGVNRLRELILFSAQHCWGCIWNAGSSSELPCRKEKRKYWSRSGQWPWRWWEACNIWYTRRGWQTWDCLAWGRLGRGSYQYV